MSPWFVSLKSASHNAPSLSYMTWLSVWHFTIRSALQCVSNRREMWSPRWDMHVALWNDAPVGKHKQMFATKHVQIPPPPFTASPPPALQKATASHVTHYQEGRRHVFGIKLLRALSNKIHFLIGSFHNIYILPFFLFFFFPLGRGCCWFTGCQVEVSHGGKVYEKQPGGESRQDRTTLGERKRAGRVDIWSKTNSLTSKPWQTLLTGPLVSQLSSQMPFKPFILFFTGTFFSLHFFWVCVCFINPQRDTLRKR